ncbi:hypothetical protein DICPUDRAFT_153275 [Dictyostelium purpureum]|uniref:Uncharacterized protein n=1 Tax=Dictyostelium purpureum TaxID=5786 RepID=F0ZNH3_DICPU|nr:uncharacterized protein DICPUDRAFT_153275 [Dictyostelium purpureum]EGC34531.1 hypothetical protein DICPUDRAFT_153275 [Dictyostelium purpureum]|eukprot:XP_003288967.1 hypothetical protein DICPUDRAFT_153275 [Dictyostelium purpureum]
METTDYAIATSNKIDKYKKKVLEEAYSKINNYARKQWESYYSLKNQKENEDRNNTLDVIINNSNA